MSRLIQKSGFIKAGKAAGYMKYIATRCGVEKLHGRGPATEGQKKLITDLLCDFPDTADLFEYEDYCASPTLGTASTFITMALDTNAHQLQDRDGYLKYIATRPRVERRGDHGLFGSEDDIDLNSVMAEVGSHEGNVWTIIYSLRRSDAARLGYDNAASWRGLLLQHQSALADALKISDNHFRWYAAFHNEGNHPHIHMMLWSDEPKQGYLSRDGIELMRSKLTNTIFRDELHELYVQKDIAYKNLKYATQEAMQQLITQMKQQVYNSPVISQLMVRLADELQTVSGKKQYGYLQKPLKDLVDNIVDELSAFPDVAQCYDAWNHLRDELQGYYNQAPREHLPLSQQKEFRAIKNMVIREAENIALDVLTFEDNHMTDEEEPPDEPIRIEEQTIYKQASAYLQAKALLNDWDIPMSEKSKAISSLETLWKEGYTVAAHLLGKHYRDGTEIFHDPEKAELWFRRSAETGNDFSEYALGKLLLSQGRTTEAVDWLQKAADHGNQHAQYRLGKMYLSGDVIDENIPQGIEHLTHSAVHGNQFAQYALGKLYLQGKFVPQDKKLAKSWLEHSAAEGNQYAQFFLNHFNDIRPPSVLLAATTLLCHMSNIFRDNSPAPSNPAGLRIDSKRRRQLQRKRLAMGHKPDDHEEHTQNLS